MSALPPIRKCSACGADLLFLPHVKSGTISPITAYEVPDGNVAILENGTYRIILKGEDYSGPRHLSHFTDCPERHRFGARRSR